MRDTFKASCVLALLALSALVLANRAVAAETGQTLFAVQIRLGPNWDVARAPADQAFFEEHSANLKRLREAGHIVMGARYSDIGLIIFSAPAIDAVRAFMDADPAMSAGTFRYDVHPINVFYPWRAGTED